jgi:hypothetical protein
VRVGVRCSLPYGADLAARRGGPAVPKDGGQGCGIGPNALLDVTSELQAARPNDWMTLDLPLACLARRGADLSRVSALLAMTTDGHFDVTVSEIKYVKVGGATSCAPTSLQLHPDR